MEKVNKYSYDMVLLSSLAKVFPDERPLYQPEALKLTALRGETVSFQLAYTSDCPFRQMARLRLDSQLKDSIRLRSVEEVPVSKAAHAVVDDNYLRTSPGLYPDLLRDLDQGRVKIKSGLWSSLWIDVEVGKDIDPGTYDIRLDLLDDDGEDLLASKTMEVTIYDPVLPDQDIIHTEWFHADCLADYYGVGVFSEDHWEIIDNFLENYTARGCNMILTPLFTYPLDTKVGLERTRTQLVGVDLDNGAYSFDFTRLKRWLDLCLKHGIEYFEMSHIFSQWGAKYAPNIVAKVDGKEEKIFGWHTPAVGAYTDFLKAFVPALVDQLKDWDLLDQTYFHISDVPRKDHLDTYKESIHSLGDLFKDLKTFEAVAYYDFYDQGLVNIPVAATSSIHDFTGKGIDELWAYYCTGQYKDVSNRFMAMPSARNRVLGIQLYKYGIRGFLHWGYNFYNSALSLRHIDPYKVTDADDAFPAGDPFLVYPGEDRRPEESIRMMVTYQAFTDHRALKYLEELTDKDYVLDLIEEDLFEPISFYQYPKDASYLIRLRNRVNKEIAKRLADKE